jgi:peptidoglycan hydrolase CwlO-like protein
MSTESKWVLDRNINVSAIIMCLVMLAGFIVYSNNQASLIAVHTNQIGQLQEGQKDIKTEINSRFDKLENKIDTLIERNMKMNKR